MENIRIDLSRVADMDPLAMGQRVTRPPRISVPPSLLGTLKGGLRQYSATPTRPGAAMLGDMLNPRSRKPKINFLGAIKKAAFPPSNDVTIGIGPGFSTASLISVGAGLGVYGWYKAPGLGAEIGFYGTWDVGLASNLSFAVQLSVTYMWCDAPTYFFGDCIVVGVDLSVGGTGAYSGYLIFTNPARGPLYFVGLTFAAGAGFSVAPVDITVQFTRTYKAASMTVGGAGLAKKP
jgi:hypothetical protein